MKVGPTSWTFNNCTRAVKVLNLGQLTLQYFPEEKFNKTRGTLIAKGLEIEVGTPFGNCIFKTGPETIMGVLTSRNLETAATIHISTVLNGGFLCPSSPFVAAYHISLPAPLYFKEETA